jgi:hypothetical protein
MFPANGTAHALRPLPPSNLELIPEMGEGSKEVNK